MINIDNFVKDKNWALDKATRLQDYILHEAKAPYKYIMVNCLNELNNYIKEVSHLIEVLLEEK